MSPRRTESVRKSHIVRCSVTEGDQRRDGDDDVVHSESCLSNPDAHAGYAECIRQAKADGEIDRVGESQMARHGDGTEVVMWSRDVCRIS